MKHLKGRKFYSMLSRKVCPRESSSNSSSWLWSYKCNYSLTSENVAPSYLPPCHPPLMQPLALNVFPLSSLHPLVHLPHRRLPSSPHTRTLLSRSNLKFLLQPRKKKYIYIILYRIYNNIILWYIIYILYIYFLLFQFRWLSHSAVLQPLVTQLHYMELSFESKDLDSSPSFESTICATLGTWLF